MSLAQGLYMRMSQDLLSEGAELPLKVSHTPNKLCTSLTVQPIYTGQANDALVNGLAQNLYRTLVTVTHQGNQGCSASVGGFQEDLFPGCEPDFCTF